MQKAARHGSGIQCWKGDESMAAVAYLSSTLHIFILQSGVEAFLLQADQDATAQIQLLLALKRTWTCLYDCIRRTRWFLFDNDSCCSTFFPLTTSPGKARRYETAGCQRGCQVEIDASLPIPDAAGKALEMQTITQTSSSKLNVNSTVRSCAMLPLRCTQRENSSQTLFSMQFGK